MLKLLLATLQKGHTLLSLQHTMQNTVFVYNVFDTDDPCHSDMRKTNLHQSALI